MAQRRGRRLGRPSMLGRTSYMGGDGLNAARFKLVSQNSNFRFVAEQQVLRPLATDQRTTSLDNLREDKLLFHFELRLFQLINLLSDHFHLP